MVRRWMDKALAFEKLGRHKVANHCLDRAIEVDSHDSEVWCFKGVILEKMGKHEEAIECYEEATNINPFHALAWYNRGAALGNFGRYRQALSCFEEADRQGHPKAATAARACQRELARS